MKFVIVHEILNKRLRDQPKLFNSQVSDETNFHVSFAEKKIIMASLIFISSLVGWIENWKTLRL